MRSGGLFFPSWFPFIHGITIASVRQGAEESGEIEVAEKKVDQSWVRWILAREFFSGEREDSCGHRRLLSCVFFCLERTAFTIRESAGPVNVRV